MPHKYHRRKRNDLDAFIISIIDAILTLWFYLFYSLYLVIKAVVSRRPIEKHSLKQQKAYKRAFGGAVLIIILMSLGCWAIPGLWVIFVVTAVIILIPLVVILFMKRQKRRAITSSIDKYLRKALEDMDSTARWYNDENEANRELVSCLKSQGISDVIYQCRLNNGRVADAKVGDCLIEGKLSPTTDEIDRLIGQISDYVRYTNKLNIVIYGEFRKEAKRRIESEIHSRYRNKVFITYLNNPRRLRNLYS